MNPLVRTEQLYRYYGATCAVGAVSFTLDKGEVLGFLGPNGAGKTTTMQMLCGILAPSSGRIWIDGIDLLERPGEAKAALGYLPEIPPLHRELTVDEYLRYCGRLHRIPRRALGAALTRAKRRCGLTAAGARLIGNLSKGFQQRAGIAQAILHAPPVIILDEPTVGLDPIQIREVRNLIRELGENHGVLLSTHLLHEVDETCSRVLIIDKGRLVLNDSIEGLKRRMQASSLVLATRVPPDAETLARVTGVRSLQALGDKRFRIVFDKPCNPAAQLAEIVVAHGWGLIELTPEQQTVEQIFIETTRGAGEGEGEVV